MTYEEFTELARKALVEDESKVIGKVLKGLQCDGYELYMIFEGGQVLCATNLKPNSYGSDREIIVGDTTPNFYPYIAARLGLITKEELREVEEDESRLHRDCQEKREYETYLRLAKKYGDAK